MEPRVWNWRQQVSTNNCCHEHEDEILISYLFSEMLKTYTYKIIYRWKREKLTAQALKQK